MLSRIAENSTNVVTPVIDTIDLETLQFHLSGHNRMSVGGFNWGLVFNWHVLPDRDQKKRKTRIEPIPLVLYLAQFKHFSYRAGRKI